MQKVKLFWKIMIPVFIIILSSYCFSIYFFSSHLLFNTSINGIDCSLLSQEKLNSIFTENYNDYRISVSNNNGVKEYITASDIDLTAQTNVSSILEAQHPIFWFVSFFKSSDYTVPITFNLNDTKLNDSISHLKVLNGKTLSTDNIITYSFEQQQFVIQPAIKGDIVNQNTLFRRLKYYILNQKSHFNVEEQQCLDGVSNYTNIDDLNAILPKMNTLLQKSLTYDLLDVNDVCIDKNTLSNWINYNPHTLDVFIDQNSIKGYITEFASLYNTFDKPTIIQTPDGMVSFDANLYGWEIDIEKEVQSIVSFFDDENIEEEREPYYINSAASHSSKDYGDNYLLINLTTQHLYLYNDNDIIYDSPIVSGKNNYSTPIGVFSTQKKMSNVKLVYHSEENIDESEKEEEVNYWIQLDDNFGIYDNYSRNLFGNTIYKQFGSFGSIEIPSSSAAVLYNNINENTPVFIYNQGEEIIGKEKEEELFNDALPSYTKNIWIGDSRTVGMEAAVPDNSDDVFIAKISMSYSWFKNTAVPQLHELLSSDSHRNVFINMGVNDIAGRVSGGYTDNSESYTSYVNSLIEQYPNTQFYYISINPTDADYNNLTTVAMNNQIQKFNNYIKNNCNAIYIDSYNYLINNGFSTGDGLHFSSSTNRTIYKYAKSFIQLEKHYDDEHILYIDY